jgi:hypothetical protein
LIAHRHQPLGRAVQVDDQGGKRAA